MLDVWSRRIVGWMMDTHLKIEPVLDALNMALAQRRPDGVIHHSDRGCQLGFKASSQHGFARRGQQSIESLGGSLPSESLSRSAVKSWSDRIKIAFGVPTDICAFGKVLSQQAICIFIGTALQGLLGSQK